MSKLITIQELRQAENYPQYQPQFLDAVLATEAAATANAAEQDQNRWRIPVISFETEDWTRRSMTLNGMRMSTEYFASGSLRVLQLVEQRLEAGQTDVVHDVIVYLQEQVLQAQNEIEQAQQLSAESLAAFLGIEPKSVAMLFASSNSATEIAQKINEGFAGQPQRQLDLSAVTENLWSRLAPEVERFQERQQHIRVLINEIAERLFEYSGSEKFGRSAAPR